MNIFDRLKNETPVEKVNIVVSRHWDNPKITIFVDQNKIQIYTEINDFISAIYQELPDIKPTFMQRLKGLVSKEMIKSDLVEATKRAIEKVKESTNQVM